MSMIMEQHQFSSSRVANPLAASSSNEIDFTADSAKGSSAVDGAAGTTTTPLGVPNPISGGVPNPIMDASPSTTAVNYNNTTTTTTAPFPMVSKEASAPPTAPFTSTTPMTSLVPSPLASPSASPPYQQDNDDDLMETMRDTSCDEPPKKEQRRQRSNTIQWAIGGDTDNNNSKQQVESFEPVNFGDYRDKSPRKDSVGSWASCASHDTSSTTQSPTPLSPADHLLHDVGVVDPVSAAGSSSPAAAATGVTAGGPAFPLGFAASSDAATTTTTTCTTVVANKQASSSAVPIVDKRQKRLERNRESARASRRRRKQYLEELESNVHNLSTDMDSGRMLHALEGVKVVAGMRKGKVLKILEVLNGTAGSGGGDTDMNDASRGGRSIIATKTSSGVKHNVVPKTAVPLPPTTQQQQSQQPQSLQGLLHHTNVTLTTSLSRTQPSFQVVNTFFQQQLKSLILTHKQPITSATPNPAAAALSTSGSPILGPLLPSLTPFLLWLTLQNDDFFRGGRAQSERLSAARIGERLLHGGLYRVTPSTTGNKSAQHNDNKGGGGRVLWPLLCHEIGLSYDQEDKIRTAQRLVLQNVDLWIHRHTARATSNVIQSVHDIIGGMMELTQQKDGIENGTVQNEAAGLKTDEDADESLMSILTEEQRMKFLGWALKNQERMKRCAERNVGKNVVEVGELGVSKERHVAANMYIIDHKLGKVKQRVPPVAEKYVNPSQLKKLGRRPCFESLGGYDKDNNDVESSTKKMSRNDSSSSLLKRSLDDMSLGGTSSGLDTNVTAVTPEAAQAAGHAAASVFLKDVLSIIPAPPIKYHHPQQLQEQSHAQHYEPEPVMSVMPAPVMSANFPSQPQQQHLNAASSTFDDIPMPTPVSVLLQTPDDFLNPSDGGVNDNDMMGGVDPTAAIDPIPFVPEPVASSSISMMSRHQSAPEFGQYLGNPVAAPIGMVPVLEGEDEDDFGILDDLPMDADDWLIGDDTLEF